MSWVIHSHKMFPVLILAIFFVWSILAIALDQHDGGFSPICPICHVKISINGTQSPFALNFYPASSCQYYDVKSLGLSVPISLPFEGRAPPELPQG